MLSLWDKNTFWMWGKNEGKNRIEPRHLVFNLYKGQTKKPRGRWVQELLWASHGLPGLRR